MTDVVAVTTTSQPAGVLPSDAGVAVVLAAERGARAGVAAVDDDALERRQLRAQRGDVRGGLPPAADHAERRCAGTSEMLRGDRGRGGGSQLSERVGFEHRDDLGLVESSSGRRGTACRRRPRERLQAGETRARGRRTASTANCPLGDRQAHARRVVDLAAREPRERSLDRGTRRRRREQRATSASVRYRGMPQEDRPKDDAPGRIRTATSASAGQRSIP